MRVGLDLDGTVYAFPEFFREFIHRMSLAGWQFFCTSSHARSEWVKDCDRLNALGINAYRTSPVANTTFKGSSKWHCC